MSGLAEAGVYTPQWRGSWMSGLAEAGVYTLQIWLFDCPAEDATYVSHRK